MIKKISIFIFLATIPVLLSAGKIYKAYEALSIYDYFKAKKIFYSQLKKNKTLAAYGLSTIYLRKDNPFHNLDSAYRFIEIASEASKEKKVDIKLFGFLINDSTISDQKYKIHSESFKKYNAINKDSLLLNLERFINNQPASIYLNQAYYLRDSIVFQNYKIKGRSKLFQEYIFSFPESELLEQAYRELDFLRFDEHDNGSIKNLENFIDSFPSSKYLNEAQDRLFDLSIEKKNSALIYKYIKRFPGNSHVEKAWKSLYSLEVNTYTALSLNTFIHKYPDFPYKQTIEKELELANTFLIQVMRAGKFGCIDTSGKIIINTEFDGLEEFYDGLAMAEKNGKFGFINKLGETVVPFEYDDAEPFKNGKAIVKLDKQYYLIDRTGNKLTSGYDQISDFSEGLAVVKLQGSCGAIDKNGKLEIPFSYKRIGDFNEGVAFAQKNESFGYIDKKGDPLISFLYEWAESFNRSLARVKYNGKFGLINREGEFILQPVYDRIDVHEKGIYIVYKNQQYGFADSTGCLLSNVSYHNFNNEKAASLTDGHWLKLITEEDQNLMNHNGKKIADEEEFEEIYLPKYGLIRVLENEKFGYINERKKVIIKPAFDEADDFADSVAVVNKKGKWMILNLKGEILFAAKTTEIERISPSYFKYTNEENKTIVCNKSGQECFSSAQLKEEIIVDRYLIINLGEEINVFDLWTKKYIFRKEESSQL